ncbi:YcxB family protein [Reichenbachiella sp.]
MKKIEETIDYYFLYNTAVSAIIIPKKKIENDLEELDKILKTNIA